MFCTRCGTDLPDDSVFCRKCGHALGQAHNVDAGAAAAPALEPEKPKRVGLYLVIGLALGVLIVAWLVNQGTQDKARPNRPAAAFQVPPPPPQPQLHKVTIGSGAITVNAGGYLYFTLSVPAGATNVRIEGRFSATGGSGNDIEVFVITDDGFTNWKNGHSTPTYYNSGKVTVGEVNAVLPDGAGTYYLVFNNNFSLVTPKAVQESLSLTYYSL